MIRQEIVKEGDMLVRRTVEVSDEDGALLRVLMEHERLIIAEFNWRVAARNAPASKGHSHW